MKKMNHFMDVELVLGNPKIECDGYGICKFLQRNVTALGICEKKRLIDGKIYFVNHSCIILMNSEIVGSKNCMAHFQGGVFQIETAITLPNWITDSFDLSTVTIQSGIYAVKKHNGFFQVEIPFTVSRLGEAPLTSAFAKPACKKCEFGRFSETFTPYVV